MNIGIYVKTLRPTSPAATRFQESILEGLNQLDAPNFHFVVLSEVMPRDLKNSPRVSYVALARDSRVVVIGRKWKRLAGGLARRLLGILGADAATKRVTEWLTCEPAYFRQLRDLNVRIIWNCGKDVLDSFLPSIVVMWDSNHRIHPMFPEFSELQGPFRWPEFEDQLLRRASYIIVGTEQGKREVIETYGVYPGKIRVIPFPTPTLPSQVPARLDTVRPNFVFYPGRFKPHKNQIVLVHALRLLRERWGVIQHCVFSGIDDGNLGYVLRTAQDLGVREQIEYLGNVSLEQLADLYRTATGLVYCSAVGPDNFPPLEAMSVGCPVITADVPGAREQCGDAAIYFERTNEVQLAECIKRLLDDVHLRNSLIEKGLQRAAQWTPLDYATSMLRILDEFSLIARMWDRCDFQST
jgi:glycosyltransferase involved in cell wall biosynthesis